MLQLLQPLMSLFIGAAMTIYGLVHAITRFPGGDAFATLAKNMPAATSVLVFLLGIVAFVFGVVLLVLSVRNLRRRWRRFGRLARHVEHQPQSVDDEDGWEPAYR